MPDSSKPSFSPDNLFFPTPLSAWQRLQRQPSLFLAHWLYTHRPPCQAPLQSSKQPVKVVCISDTHNEQPARLPQGDILVHAGDITNTGSFAELQAHLDWLNTLPHAHKVVVAGNHDILLDQSFYRRYPNRRLAGPGNDEQKLATLDWGGVTYLERSSATLLVRGRSVRVYGSPFTPECGNWAFQYLRIRDIWTQSLPPSLDILVTHGPARGHVDDRDKGCAHLNREVWRVKPRLHVCGHIHVARGVEYVDWGWLQWGYDAACRGEQRIWMLVIMLVVWMNMWLRYAVLGPRRTRSAFVNAAVVGPRGVFEGDETIVVEL